MAVADVRLVQERKVLIWRPLENEQQEDDCGGNTELTAGKCEVSVGTERKNRKQKRKRGSLTL